MENNVDVKEEFNKDIDMLKNGNSGNEKVNNANKSSVESLANKVEQD
jgi:hypothetical protein